MKHFIFWSNDTNYKGEYSFPRSEWIQKCINDILYDFASLELVSHTIILTKDGYGLSLIFKQKS